jgi:hypothetical protein
VNLDDREDGRRTPGSAAIRRRSSSTGRAFRAADVIVRALAAPVAQAVATDLIVA